MLKMIVFTGMLSLSFFCQAQTKADRICGFYYVADPNNGEGSQVEIYKTANDTYEGKIVWMQYPNHPNGEPRRDVKNPNTKNRNQTNVGLVIIKGFTYNAANDEWEKGTVYNPKSGKTYNSLLKLEGSNKLKVRGYLAVSLLGKTLTWTKETTLRK